MTPLPIIIQDGGKATPAEATGVAGLHIIVKQENGSRLVPYSALMVCQGSPSFREVFKHFRGCDPELTTEDGKPISMPGITQ